LALSVELTRLEAKTVSGWCKTDVVELFDGKPQMNHTLSDDVELIAV